MTDGVALQAALSALGAHAGHVRAVEVTRTGMPLHAVFRAASRCVGLRELVVDGGRGGCVRVPHWFPYDPVRVVDADP